MVLFFQVFVVTCFIIGWPFFVAWNEWRKFRDYIPNDFGLALRICSVALVAEVVVAACVATLVAQYMGWSWYIAVSQTLLVVTGIIGLAIYMTFGVAVVLLWAIGVGFKEYDEALLEEDCA